MARTDRKAAFAAAPPASVETLDDLDLDDMFNEGEDTLFDGLDIDLDGMAEMPNASTKKKGEPRTTRTQEPVAMNFNTPSTSAAVAPSSAIPDETSKRRTTKRKIKAPPQLAEYDQEDDYPPKKKRRTSKASAKKAKATKGASSSKVSTTMPPPFSRGTMDPNNMIALTTQKKVAPGQSLVGQTSSSSLTRSNLSNASSATGYVPCGAESTYCGLLPSSTEFYPFTEAVPPEPTLRKTQFPLMNNIHSNITTTATVSASSNATTETEGLYRLLSADLDQMYNDRNTSQAANDQRRANLGHVISTSRTTVAQADRKQLLKKFREMCFLLKRQYDFLNQNVANMERWCRENYSAADYESVYETLPSGKLGSSSVGTLQHAGSLIASLKSPILKVKVRCSGFKPPKPYLIAHVRLPRAAPPSTKSDTSRTSSTKKRNKVADTDRSSLSILAIEDEVTKEVSYVDMKPTQRRRHVADAVAQRAQTLELQIKESREKHRRNIERQRAEQQKIVDDDEIVSINTMTMWKWLEKSPHFADYSEADLKQVLEYIWEPELVNADVLTKPAEEIFCRRSSAPASSDACPDDSAFLRLQSLLVDEGSDDEDEDFDLVVEDDRASVKEASEGSTILDLSGFSLDERAWIHLRAAGLIDHIRPLVARSTFIENDDRLLSKGATRPTRMESKKTGENDIDAVILSMQAELLDQRRENNGRLAFLEYAARSHIESTKQLKKREDETASMVARYNQMLKKQKEAKRSTRTRPTNEDGAWMPW